MAFRKEDLILWSVFCSPELFFLVLPCMKMYGACVCSVYSWWGLLSTLPTPPLLSLSIHPMIPARLSGRVLDSLSDEMMTLLWEVIPEWEVSNKDCALLPPPRCPPAPHWQLCWWWLIRFRWITGSTHWFSSVLSRILIYSCINEAWTWLTL